MEIPHSVRKDLRILKKLPSKEAQKRYVFEEFLKVAKRFNSECYVCNVRMSEETKKIGWTFHHKYYNSSELSYRYYDRTKDEFLWKGKDWSQKNPIIQDKVKKIDMRSLYRLEVFRQVRKRKTQFLLMCSRHHQALEKLDQFAPPKVKRLIKAWKMTKTKWKVK